MKMRQVLEYCFQTNPFLNKTYLILKKYLKLSFGTRWDEIYWAKRHLWDNKRDDWGGGKDWIKGYWDSQNHPHRNFLIERISEFSPFENILEVGCNCGPNLYLLGKKFPNTDIKGIDISPLAIQRGKEWLTQEGISNVKLLACKADELERFQDKSFDLVFTDAVLIYIGPDKINKVIREMLRVSRRGVILLEWHCFESKCSPYGFYVGYWVRDYMNLLKKFVPKEKISIIKLPEDLWLDENWQRYGGVVKIIME